MPAPSPSSLPGAPPRALLLAVLGLAAAVFAGTWDGGFLGDDFVYISRFNAFPWENWPRLFVREWSEGIWGSPLKELRPFAALSYMVDARIFGGQSWGYRLDNLLLHLGCVAGVTLLAWRYSGGRRRAAWAAGLVFALHPAHAEAVAWITGRVDLLAALAALGFWLTAEAWGDRGRPRALATALVLCFSGIFAKEFFLLAPLLVALRWVAVDFRVSRAHWGRRLGLLAGAGACIVVYAVCRHAAFGPAATSGGAPWRDPGSWGRQSSYFGWLLPLLPFADQPEFAHPLPPGLMQALGLALAVGTAGLLAAAARRRDQLLGNLVFFTGGWYLVTLGSLLVVGYFSPRHLYFPTAGLAVGCGLLAARLPRGPALTTLLGTAAVAGLAAGFFAALQPWRDNGALSRAMLAGLQQDLDGEPPGTVVATSVPEIAHHAWLWSWSSPQLFSAPFFAPPRRGEFILERTGNYHRPDDWLRDRNAVKVIAAAPGAVLLSADADRRWRHRRVPRDELLAHLPALAGQAERGLTTEAWTAWVRGFFPP